MSRIDVGVGRHASLQQETDDERNKIIGYSVQDELSQQCGVPIG
jgi:hypothetical protein